MAGTVKRTLKNGGSIDQGSIDAIEHNAYAGAKKMLPVGPEFSPTTGQDASGAGGLNLAPGTIVGFYNNSASVGWVAFGATVPAAPSSFATGIPLPPNSWTWMNMGENKFVRTGTGSVGVYTIKDDSVYTSVAIP